MAFPKTSQEVVDRRQKGQADGLRYSKRCYIEKGQRAELIRSSGHAECIYHVDVQVVDDGQTVLFVVDGG